MRSALLRRAWWLALATVIWNVAEGLVGVAAGLAARSVALVGFGVDSFVETTSGAIVLWRVAAERTAGDPERVERTERRAARIAGSLLLLLAAYVLVDSLRRLLGFGPRAGESGVGVALTAISLVVMPVLGRAKLRVANALGSRALRADAFETIACAWLSLATLAGLALNAWLGWWWADPLAGLALVPLIAREGLEGVRGDPCGCGNA